MQLTAFFHESNTNNSHQIALLIQLIPQPINWKDFKPPEGRTMKACQLRWGSLKSKAGQVNKEGEETAGDNGGTPPKTPPKPSPKTTRKKSTKKDNDDNGEGGKKATPSKKRKVKDEADEDVTESPSKRSKVEKAEVEEDEAGF